MANSSTLIDTLRGGVGQTDAVKVYSVVLTTTGTDLTVYTPGSDRRAYIVGMIMSNTVATNLSFYSTSGNLAGTVATTSGATTITGTSTSFLTDFQAGPNYQIVTSAGDTLTIATRPSATSMTSTANAGNTASGLTYTRRLLVTKLELAANQGIYDKVSKGYGICTRVGDSLVMQASGALDYCLLFVAEAADGIVLR